MEYETHEPDSDFKYGAQCSGLDLSDIVDVKAQVPGEADSQNWYWLCKMKDKSYRLYWGWCDYTGWDCRSFMEYIQMDDWERLLDWASESFWEKAQKPIKIQLKDQMNHKQPYALREA